MTTQPPNKSCIIRGTPGSTPLTIIGPFDTPEEAQQYIQNDTQEASTPSMVDVLVNPANCWDEAAGSRSCALTATSTPRYTSSAAGTSSRWHTTARTNRSPRCPHRSAAATRPRSALSTSHRGGFSDAR